MSKLTHTENRYAICIGINQYHPSVGLNALHYAESDARAMDELLDQLGFTPENRCLLLGESANLNSVNDAMFEFILDKPGENDLVIFYFAGHSLPLTINQSAVQNGAEPTSEVFLATYDFDREKIKQSLSFRKHSALGLERLRKDFFEGEGSRKRLFLFDSCYSGDFYGPRYRDEEDPVQSYIKHMLDSSSTGRVVLSSCLPIQKAMEDSTLGHGRFTYYVLEALSGRAVEAFRRDGCLTVNGLFEYLAKKLPSDQRPVLSGVQQDTFELVCYFEKKEQLFEPLLGTEAIERTERKVRLQAMLADHSGFMQDRLESFVGRQRELEEIHQRIVEKLPTGGYVTITGQAGQGKSSIISKLVEEYGPENVAFHFIPLNPGPDHQVGLLRNLMVRLILKYDLSDLFVASENRAVLRDYVPKVLVEIAQKGAQEVIFIDGLDQLDEDISGVRDLSFLPINPPPGVVFVLGTRPNDTLRPLALLKPHSEYVLPNLSRHDFDLILHRRKVDLDMFLTDQFYHVMQENALYLDLVARELAEEGMISPTEIIKRIANDPNSIFSLAMSRFKRHRPQWREIIKPVLGVLLAAREPLTIRHIRQLLEVEDDWLREGIERLGGLIAKDGQQRCSLFHLKLQDYLRQDESYPEKEYIFATDEEEGWHKKLAQWCEQSNLSIIWQDAKGNPMEHGRREYARRHYVTHLYLAKEWQHLFTVLNTEAYGKAKVRVDPSTRSFAQDLDLGRFAAANAESTFEKGLELLPQLWQYTLLGCSLTSRADKYPIEAFEALILLRRETEAVGLAELLTKLEFKVEALLSIAKQFRQQNNREQENLQMLLRAFEVARTLKDDEKFSALLIELSMELIENHLWEQAENLANTIEDSEIQAVVLSNLCMGLIGAQQWSRAEEMAHSLKDSNVRAEMLSSLCMDLIMAQHWERVEVVAQTIDSRELQLKVLNELCMELIKVQQWEQAAKVANTIKNREARAKILQELVVALTKAHQWQRAEAVVATITDQRVLTELRSELSIELAKAHQWQRAEAVVVTITDPNSLNKVKGEVSIELIKAHQWKQAQEMMISIKDLEILDLVKGELSVELAKAHKWKQAQEIANTIKTQNEHIRALSELSSRLIEAQQWKRAEVVSRTIEESGERVKVLGELFIMLAETDQVLQVDRIWINIKKEIRLIEQWKRIGVVSDLIVELSNAHQWERAEELTRIFKQDYISAELLYTFVTTLAKAQQWELAVKVWTKAEKIDWPDDEHGIRNQALYELAIGLTRAHLWEHAEMLWAEAEDIVRNAEYFEEFISTLCSLVTASIKAQQYHRAGKILETMEQSLDNWKFLDRYWMLIELGEALIKALQWERGEQEAKLVSPIERHAWELIATGNALEQEQQWDQALEAAEDIDDTIEQDEVLCELGIELAQAQHWERTEWVAKLIRDHKKRDEVLCELSFELAEAQHWERAREIARNIEDSGVRARVLYVLAASLAEVESWKQAQEVWLEATVMEWADIESVHALSEIGTALAKAGQGKQAQEVWLQAKEAIHSLRREEEPEDEISVEVDYEVASKSASNSLFIDQLLIELISALNLCQCWEQAEEVARVVVDPLAKVEIMGNISNALAGAGQNSKSEKIWVDLIKEARSIQDNWNRVEVLQSLGMALAQAQQWAFAETIVHLIEEPGASAEILIELGTCHAQRGHWEEAKKAWRRAKEEVSEIDDIWISTETLGKLVISLAQAQQWNQAESVAHMISEPKHRADVLIQLGNQLAQKSHWGQAIKVWREAQEATFSIWEHEVRAELLQKLGTALFQAQQWEYAEKLWVEAEEEAYLIRNHLAEEEVLGEISQSFALVHRWEKSEEIAKKIRGNVYRTQIFIELGSQLARAQELERAKFILADAESLAYTIENVETKKIMLKKIAEGLNFMRAHEQLLHLVQRSWLQAQTRDQALKLLSLADELIPLRPEIGVAFCESFTWVDIILRE